MFRQKTHTLCLISLIFTLVLVGCASKKKLVYFQGENNLPDTLANFEPKIQADDILDVDISGSDPTLLVPFATESAVSVNSTRIMYQNGVAASGYLVSNTGNVNLPYLGEVHVAGLTRQEATDTIQTFLEGYLKQPIVNVRILNFKITVMGDVGNPGTYTIPNERITILEALGLAGDLNITGRRKNVLVIRETDGKMEEFRIDLTQKELFNSPAYYLKQNDVVYVEQNRAKLNTSKYTPVYAVLISATTLIISTVALVTKTK